MRKIEKRFITQKREIILINVKYIYVHDALYKHLNVWMIKKCGEKNIQGNKEDCCEQNDNKSNQRSCSDFLMS